MSQWVQVFYCVSRMSSRSRRSRRYYLYRFLLRLRRRRVTVTNNNYDDDGLVYKKCHCSWRRRMKNKEQSSRKRIVLGLAIGIGDGWSCGWQTIHNARTIRAKKKNFCVKRRPFIRFKFQPRRRRLNVSAAVNREPFDKKKSRAKSSRTDTLFISNFLLNVSRLMIDIWQQ